MVKKPDLNSHVPNSFEILSEVGTGEGFKNAALLFSISALFL